MFITIFLAVFLLYTMHMLVSSLSYSLYASWSRPMEHFSLVLPVSEERPLEQKVQDGIKGHAAVDSVIPMVLQGTDITNTFGGSSTTMALAVKGNDRESIMSELGLTLKDGKLPAAGTKEIAVHWRIATNKGWKIGDKIGSYVDKGERLPGQYTVVGLLDGPSMISFISLETYAAEHNLTDQDLYKTGMLVLPKSEALESMNRYLADIPSYDAKVMSYDTEMADVNEILDSINTTMMIIEGMLIVVLSISVGLLSYIYFYQRHNEFGLLYAMGYTRGQVINRAVSEISGMNIAGFTIGILLALLGGLLLNEFVYIPQGQPLELWNWGYVLRTFSIPLFVMLFSIFPVWRMLSRLDPISIIEGVE